MVTKRTPQAREKGVVVDSSIAVAWCFPDEKAPYPQSVLDALPESGAVVPSLWRLEVVNALLMGERRGRCSQTDVSIWAGFLASLSIHIDEETVRHACGETLILATIHTLSSYDAAYIELALRRDLPLATLDR